MCFGRPAPPPAPAPLPAAPPPPAPPIPPKPVVPIPTTPAGTDTDINPQVRTAKEKKIKNEMTRGTAELRIPLEGQVNTANPTDTKAGGLNK